MNSKELVKKEFRTYLETTFNKKAEDLKIFIYELQLQICGGILKFEDELDITLISDDLRYIGYEYSGHVCKLPEMCVPYDENTVVLVSCVYDYKYKEIRQKLTKYGIGENNIVHVREFAQNILNISADYFSQNAMDNKVKMLFDSIGRDISTIRYLDIGANTWLLYNNTYMFYRSGANGVLVEANPDFIDEIKNNRSRDTAIMCGCSETESDEMWTYYKTPHAGYNTFVKEIADTYDKKTLPIQEIKIAMKSIGSILQENFPTKHLDYMSVDVEGMGVRLVNAIDFEKYSIDVILLEMDYDEEESKQLYLKLLKLGYVARYRGIGAGKDFLFYKESVFGKDVI